jgi:sugar lactone lactonase YvrE
MTVAITRIGDFKQAWGESARWDDRRQRLYMVDCATQTLHWLENGLPPMQTLVLPSMPTGVALTEGPELVICLDEGLCVVNPDDGSTELLSRYPAGLHGRANDACADGFGNLVTGTLNLDVAPGAYWWFSSVDGWRLLDDDISNANGPVMIDLDGMSTLVFADTPSQRIYAYSYDGERGVVGPRRSFGDHSDLRGAPDGATADKEGGVWSCVLLGGKVVRLTGEGRDRVIDLPVVNPSDVAFGGPRLDRLFVTSISFELDPSSPVGEDDGCLCVVDGLGVAGRPETRFKL